MTTAKVRTTARHLDTGKIFIVDGLFEPGIVMMLHELCRGMSFLRSEYSTGEDGESPTLNSNFDEASYASNPVLRRFRETVIGQVRDLFPDKDWRLSRIHCNAQMRGDFQMPHSDLKQGVTALYYANADWPRNGQGETLFHDSSGEPVAAVALKPGRLVVFEADIVHRGGVPSIDCNEMRLSIAFKFARPT